MFELRRSIAELPAELGRSLNCNAGWKFGVSA
jgi:hypothetical protein